MTPLISRLLLVDPTLGLASMLAVMLEGYCRVESAIDAIAAVRTYESTIPDVLVVDVTMPGLDVGTFVDSIKGRNSDVCLIAVGGEKDMSRLQRMSSAHDVAGIFSRGVDFAPLLVRVARLLSLGVKWDAKGLLTTPYTGRTLEYVGANYHANITLAHAARAACISSSHLSHLFPEITKLTLKEYVTRVRVDVSKRVLPYTRSTESVAQECGFCDAPHLTRTFRRHVGLGPAAYRRAVMAAPESQS